MPPEVVLFRLAVAAGVGFLIGYERELHGRSAGLRTQIVVSVSSCLLMIISLELRTIHEGLTAAGVVRLDPGRIASYAVAGIGFLGAGAIIHGRGSVQGLTTAACLWAANGIGLAVGAGLILPAVAATALVLTTLIVLQPLVYALPRDTYWRIYLDFDTCGDKIPEIQALLSEYKVRIIHTGFECRYDAASSSYEVAIRLKSTQDLMDIFGSLRRLEGLVRLKWAEGFVP